MGGDFENNPISRQGGTRISSPRPVSNIEWTKLKKKKKEKEKERGEKRERERLKSKRDTCVSGIEREGEISISNRQQHAEGKLDLWCAAFEARNRLGQSDGGRCCWPRCFSRRISRPGGRKVSDAESGESFIKDPSTRRLSRILRNETKREKETEFHFPLPFSFFERRSHRTSKIRKARGK